MTTKDFKSGVMYQGTDVSAQGSATPTRKGLPSSSQWQSTTISWTEADKRNWIWAAQDVWNVSQKWIQSFK